MWKNVYGCHHNTTVLTAAAAAVVVVYGMACYVNKKYSMCVGSPSAVDFFMFLRREGGRHT